MRSSDRSLPVPDRRDRHHAPRPRPAAGGKRTGRDAAEAAPAAILPRALVALRSGIRAVCARNAPISSCATYSVTSSVGASTGGATGCEYAAGSVGTIRRVLQMYTLIPIVTANITATAIARWRGIMARPLIYRAPRAPPTRSTPILIADTGSTSNQRFHLLARRLQWRLPRS